MAIRLEELKARFDELDELPYGPERIEGHLALSAAAEGVGDPSFRCKLLVWISDDYMETGDEARMAEYFDRAWALFREHRDEIDEGVRFNLRTTFAPTIGYLDENPDVPDEVVLARLDELDGFYRENGYSMRIPHRTRYWYHRRRGENDLAAEQIELMIAAPGDSGARCDAMGPTVGAQWYQGPGGDRGRAVELWRSILEMPDIRCQDDHRGQAHSELALLYATLERGGPAREHHRAGYPLIRRVADRWRPLDLHMIYAIRARDVVGFARIVHDHVEYLDAPMDDDVSWYQGRVLQFLHLLEARGHGALPFTLADRSEITARALRARIDAALLAHADGQPDERQRAHYTEQLETFRTRVPDKLELPAEEEDDGFWDSTLPPVPAPWAAPPDLEDLPKGWSAQDALLADARVLAFMDHPHAEGAWAAVAALGTPRTVADQARLAEYRSEFLVREGDYAAGRAMKLEAARLFDEAGRPNRALYDRVLAALAACLTGERDTALAERDAVVAQANARYEAGAMSESELLEILVEDFRLNAFIEIMTFGADPAELMDNTETNAKFSAASRLYLDKRAAHGPWAGLVDAWGFYRQQMSRLYSRYGVLPDFVRETTAKVDYWFARARDGYRDAMQFPQQAERELSRGKNLLYAELPVDALAAAEEALRLAAGLRHKEIGEMRLLQARALAACAGEDGARDEELLGAAREAAWALAGEDEEDAAHARTLIADVHRRAGKFEAALAVYDAVVRALGTEGWESRDTRETLRRATAGKVGCLYGLGRAPQAQALLAELFASLPEWNRITVGWIRYDAGHALARLGAGQEATAQFEEAIRISREAGELDPHASALLAAARLAAPQDPKAAFAMVDEAVALFDRFLDEDLRRDAERTARRAEEARERGEEAEPTLPAQPDPLKLARRARAGALKARLLFEPELAPRDVLERLLPEAYRAATEAAETLAALLRASAEDDPRRRAMVAELGELVDRVAGIEAEGGDQAGAAARRAGFAALAEECGFAEYARTASGDAADESEGGGGVADGRARSGAGD